MKGGIFINKKYKPRNKSLQYYDVILKFFKRVSVLYKYILDKDVSILKKLLVISMIIYVFSPLDIIPEVVLGFGFIDDTLLAVYVISSISKELDKYISRGEEENTDIDKGKIIDYVKYKVEDEEHDEEN